MSAGRQRLHHELAYHSDRLRAKLMRFLKRIVNRQERHKANRNPECETAYRRFNGYAD